MNQPDVCSHGSHPSFCLDCLDGPPAAVSPNRLLPVATCLPFPSRYRGCCSVCDEWWDEGFDIIRVEDGTYACASCARPVGT